MSRIGKLPVAIPSGVDVKIESDEVRVKGPKGELHQHILSQVVDVKLEDGKVKHSVRDVALSGGILYAADEHGNFIRLYDPLTGTPWGISSKAEGAVHILINDGVVYVSAGTQILSGPCPTLPITSPSPTTVCLNLTPLIPDLPGEGAGMTFDLNGNFYVAIRTTKVQVLKYTSFQAKPTVLIDESGLPDAPEFIAYILND